MILKNLHYLSVGIIFLNIFASNGSLAHSTEKALLDKLLNEYNTLERPVLNSNDTMNIKIGITITNINELNVQEGYLVTHMWQTLKWVDINLMWNPGDYEGITRLVIPPHRIWKPDILLRNSGHHEFDTAYQTDVVVSNNGSCTYAPPGTFLVSCTTDVINYPLDQHKCFLNFGSLSYNAKKINLQFVPNSGGDFSRLMPHAEWELIGIPASVDRVYYANDPEPFMEVTFIMEWKRRGEAIFSAFSFALFLGVLGTIISCFLPPISGHRISLGIVTLLSIFYMGYIIQANLYGRPSKLVSYFRRLSFLITISVTLNVLIAHIYNLNPSIQRMPLRLKKIMLDFIPPFNLLKRPTKHDNFIRDSPGTGIRDVSRTGSQDQYEELVSDLQTFVQNFDKKQNQISAVNDWEYFAIVLNRFTLLTIIVASILFCIVFYCSFI